MAQQQQQYHSQWRGGPASGDSSGCRFSCGFNVFDDADSSSAAAVGSSAIRPKLGGTPCGVSVEVGKWTFTSIRKAIQMRGRPLTLSFRNDFLTTEKQRVLTKAVRDMEPPAAAAPAVIARPMVYYHRDPRSVSTASTESHDADLLQLLDGEEESSIRSVPSSTRSVHWSEEDDDSSSVPRYSASMRHSSSNHNSHHTTGFNHLVMQDPPLLLVGRGSTHGQPAVQQQQQWNWWWHWFHVKRHALYSQVHETPTGISGRHATAPRFQGRTTVCLN